MFGIDSPELLVIAIVALIVIGPKELPGLLKSWGKWMAKMRGMASEFRGHVDEMVRQSDLDEVKKQLEASPGLDLQSLDPTKEIKAHLQEGMAEGEKAIAEAKSTFDSPLGDPPLSDSPLAEPDSAPQIGVEETPAPVVSTADSSPAEPPPALPSVPPAESEPAPPKAAAAG